MSDFKLVHRPLLNGNEEVAPSLLVWETCRRQIFFLNSEQMENFETKPGDQFFYDSEAAAFLAEVLCGLHSPLLGETEVFGQFKTWWRNLSQENLWKRRHLTMMENLFSMVKSVREKVLCGQGSQSYGSLLRKHLVQKQGVDIVGAGQLAQEIMPWIQDKTSLRIWCRNPLRASEASSTVPVLNMSLSPGALAPAVVVAAPLSHEELQHFLQDRGFGKEHRLFDFRAHSADFEPSVKPALHFTLRDFFGQSEQYQKNRQQVLERAKERIRGWGEVQQNRIQIRPYGWDDL